MTLFRELIIGMIYQSHQSERCDKDGGHAQQGLSHFLVVFLRLDDFYLREEVYGHEDRELLSFSDKL
jgi:hypothetical protein